MSHAVDIIPKSESRRVERKLYQSYVKRILDIFLVLIALPAVLPMTLIIALAIKRDGGPAFYSQARVGRNGEIFRMWKLRSMVVDAERKLDELLDHDIAARLEWIETQKLKRDPRITPLGQLIRKTSLDELPQLWNVLIGDMSLVGPRPFMPEQMELYPGDDYYRLRPGLTGLWQVHDRNGTSFAARAIFDARYNAEVSFWTDMRVMFATVAVVARKTGY
ncbi:sugar transferase [Rubellimicrobium rubrum]|uniref:Sugar transferase n=1 Tax=Rubellimicrobium rubrum TaxID=2585369 RepID=A0A5C4MY46_9RHOB|nr:sugar transferase [Rubellimicrobium rubrum]TNC50397.1 sugar transferase [Rubellimicrobium rubrum]